jgi:hypothetical protein
MLPDNLAIGSSIQVYLDLGYDLDEAIDRAAHADHLFRRRHKHLNGRELMEQLQISADCSRWAAQHYGLNDTVRSNAHKEA